MLTHHLASLEDQRLSGVLRVGGGEGFGVYTASFAEQLSVVVDCATLNDLLQEDDIDALPVRVMLFDSELARDTYLAGLLGPSCFTGEQ
jgi:hypothetical protein